MARYLVTGGCGFIGSHLVDRLIGQGNEVVVLDNLSTGHRKNLPVDVPVIVDDILNINELSDQVGAIDGCFHLAAIASVKSSMEAWRGTHMVNLTAFIGLMDMIAQSDRPNIPIVYASSAAIYGDSSELPLSEAVLLRPISAYGADKLGCEHHALAGSLAFGLRTTGLRFFNVYGPRQSPSSPYAGVISIFVRKVLDGRPITVFGDGEQSRDFVYVQDVVSALIAAIRRDGQLAEVVNVCSGISTKVNQLVDLLLSNVKNSVSVEHAPCISGDIRHSCGDTRKMNELLGIIADTPLSEGLRETLHWMRRQKKADGNVR